MILAGADLAWQSEKNPSAVSFGELNGNTLSVQQVLPDILGIDNVYPCHWKQQTKTNIKLKK